MDKLLKLKVYVDGGVNDTPFPSAEDQIEIGAFRYDAKRMGGAPTITATVNYPTCLDKVWTDLVYTELNGERYFLKQTPTSTLNNEDSRYRHDLEFVAERVKLDNTYFYDAVVGEPQENDKPVTNDTRFNFYGNIEDFVKRMNASLQYTGMQKVDDEGNYAGGYRVILDDDVATRVDKLVSFDGAVFSQALQECYNTFNVPFYFDGYAIHVGFTNNVIEDVLEYGVDGALLSATKQNANFKVINRATGKGSTGNLPYYYPNNSPKGEIEAKVTTSSNDFSVEVKDYEVFANEVSIDGIVKYASPEAIIKSIYGKSKTVSLVRVPNYTLKSKITIESDSGGKTRLSISPDISLTKYAWSYWEEKWQANVERGQDDMALTIYVNGIQIAHTKVGQNATTFELNLTKGTTVVDVNLFWSNGEYTQLHKYEGKIGIESSIENIASWSYNEKSIDLEDIGLSTNGTPNVGDSITQRLIKRVNISENLQPSIYRATDGKERFYNAINYPFVPSEGYELKYGEYIKDGKVHNDAYKKDNGEYYEFTNEYKEGRPREHVFTVDDLEPTIKEMTNDISWTETDEEGETQTVFQRIDMFSEFAYNIGDNDETYTDPNGEISYKHPYFFAKLRKLDFNLFDSASENGAMTFSMTSGHCGACAFELGVSEEEPQFNPVQVYEEDVYEGGVLVHPKGSLKYDENGYVRCGLEDWQSKEWPQDMQQDTVNNEVWIALKKETSTYGIFMPKAPRYENEDELIYDQNGVAANGVVIEAGHRPKACSSANANDGDTFVILNINLPEEYIYFAERKLEKKVVQYIWENNVEKFNFSVNFSRIFLAENPSVTDLLNENARLTRVKYNGDEYILYVSSYSYVMNEGDVLPEIRVDLDDTLTISQNALQNAIDGVKSDINKAINSLDMAAIGSKYFLRKDTEDVAEGVIAFEKGVIFGDYSDVEVMEDGTAKLTIDYLEVTKKATFTSLEIQEKTHAGGQILLTPAAMICNEVEELEDSYRCYFQTKGDNGEEIFNQFVVGDQAISQTFNEWGGHYYWRYVVGVGENYVDLSKTDCATESDAPSIGDKIIQLGNRTNEERQNAIVIAAYGEGSPYIIQYKGINGFALSEDKIVTKLSSTENIFTGKVHMELGSDGLTSFSEWNELNNSITDLEKAVDDAQDELERTYDMAAVDGLISDAEKKAIAEAEAKVNEAKEELENYTDEAIGSINIGGTNLLRNSGFTGDYLSEQLADESVLESTTELYNDPFAYWDGGAYATIVELPNVAASGFGVHLGGTTIQQTLYYNLIKDEPYTLSFKAKADVEFDEGQHHIDIMCGGTTHNITATTEWKKYVINFTSLIETKAFSLGGVDVTMCDIKLERGNTATSWSDSIFDNSSDRAYWQSMKHIQNALDGATDVNGGLVLTEQIRVGDYDKENKAWVKENGGMSGVYESDSDIAFWAGGDSTKAIATAMKYENDPTYQPTEEELASMVNFVVTHGGRAILNEAIVRGKVYATDGIFQGTIYANSGVFGGRLQLGFQQVSGSHTLTIEDSSSIWLSGGGYSLTLTLPQNDDFDGWMLTVLTYPRVSKSDPVGTILGDILCPHKTDDSGKYRASQIALPNGGALQFVYSKITHEWILLNESATGVEYIRITE